MHEHEQYNALSIDTYGCVSKHFNSCYVEYGMEPFPPEVLQFEI